MCLCVCCCWSFNFVSSVVFSISGLGVCLTMGVTMKSSLNFPFLKQRDGEGEGGFWLV